MFWGGGGGGGGVVIFSHGTSLITCSNTSFSGDIDFSSLNDGTISLTATITSSSGNSKTSDPLNLVKNTGLPTINITSPVDGTYINLNNQSAFRVSGTCSENGELITFSHGTSSITCSNTSFSGDIDFSSLNDGTVALTATITNTAGNSKTSNPLNLVKNTELPAINITSPIGGTYINLNNQNAFRVSGTCSENGELITFLHGTSSITCSNTSFSGDIDFSNLTDSTVALTATITSSSGNSKTSNPLNLVKNTELPAINITSPIGGTYINLNNQNAFRVSGTCSENGELITFLHGTSSITCSNTSFSGDIDFSNLTDSTVALTATITNTAGNSKTSNPLNLVKNTELPTINITSPVDGTFINLSNESAFSVSGTCSENGELITFSHGTSSITCSNTSFSGDIDFSSLNDGTVSLTATITSSSGNSKTSNPLNLVKNTGLPAINITSPISGTFINLNNQNAFRVSGTCSENGELITFSHGTSSITCSNASFSGDIDFSSLTDGAVALTATITNTAGNSKTSNPLNLVKNTELPTISITNPTSGTYINLNNQNAFRVSGTCSENGELITFSHGTSLITCSNTSFSGDIDFLSLTDGAVALTATITNTAGNSKTSNPLNLVKNTELPAINITSPIGGTYINLNNQNAFRVSGTCSENGELITFSHGASSITCSNTSFSGDIDFSSLTHGTVALTATITNTAGNSKTSNPLNLVKNTGLPTINITSPIGGTYINLNNQNAFRVSGTCSENGETIMFSQGTGSTTCLNQSFSGDIDFSSLNDGTVSLTATITSSSGNSKTSNPLNLVKNTELPAINITSPTNGTYINLNNQSAFSVSGTCSENGELITFSHGTSSITCSNTSFSGDIDFSSLTHGTVALTATITNTAGNSKTSNPLNLVKNTELPAINITSPMDQTFINLSNESAFSVSGTCSENGELITFSHGTSLITCSNTSFSGDIDFSSLNDGTVSLTATITSSSGNSKTSSALNLIKGIKPPTISIGDPSITTISSSNPVDFPITVSQSPSSINLQNSSVSLTGAATGCTVSVTNGTTINPSVRVSNCSAETGNIQIRIASGVAQDVAGNFSNVSNLSTAVAVQNFSGTPFKAKFSINSSDLNLNLNLSSSYTYNFIVHWGDGSSGIVTSSSDSDKNHTYSSEGVYTVTVTERCPYLSFKNSLQIIEVTELGDTGWKSFNEMFYDANNLILVNGGVTSNVTNMSFMFFSADAANPDTSNWDTSNVTNMQSMFHSAAAANPDTSNWDTSNVTHMDAMFFSADAANPDTSNWDTSNVTHMDAMFFSADAANPDTSNWDTSNVTNMQSMFHSAAAANPDTSNWDTSNVTHMDAMFFSADAANPDTSNWDTSNVTHMDAMFFSADAANPDTSNWDTSNVTHMDAMFYYADAANPDTSNWDTSNVTSMSWMFYYADAANPDTSNWDTSNVTNMSFMFFSADAANPDTSNWDTSNVTDMSLMFSYAASFDQDISSWDVSNVTSCDDFSANTLASWTRAEKPIFTHCSPGY